MGKSTKVLYGLGIDLGSGSVGWATIRVDKPVAGKPLEVLAMGVRRFDAGVSGDVEGGRDESNAVERRTKRGPRRQHWRRAWRIRKVLKTLIELRLLPEPSTVDNDFDSDTRHALIFELDEKLRVEFPAESDSAQHLLPYRIRRLALDQPISLFAFGRALYSLAQRRGFLSNRKAAGDDENEDGVVKRGIAELETAMINAGARTLGEYFAGIDPEHVKLRRQWTARRMFRNEFDAIWSAQAPHYPHLDDKAKKLIESAIFDQRPLKSQRGLVGRCELERYPIVDPKRKSADGSVKMKYVGRRRALLACLPYQEFRFLQKVNDLKFIEPDGRERALIDPDCRELRTLLLDKLSAQGEMTFGAIRKLFGFRKSATYGRNFVFNYEEGGDSKLVGNRTASKISGILGPKWFAMSDDEQTNLVDEILQFESETALEQRLRSKFKFDEAIAKKLSRVVLEQGYGSISRRAIRKLLPLMREGVPFATARKQLYTSVDSAGEVFETLPPVIESMTDLRNPAVIRVLTELRKVVNTIVREMGHPPEWIRVELARELKHSRQKRQDIQKRNKANERSRDAAKKKILECMNDERYVTADNILKIRLAEECGFVCPYSGEQISMKDLVGDEPKFEIEHTIPLSQSLDNSFLNKLLCRTDYNRRKSNRMPWKAFGGTAEYEEMLGRLRFLRGDAREAKLQRFQMQKPDDDFVNRQLNDTRYAARLATTYLAHLYGGPIDVNGSRRVFPTAGRITAYLRQRWDLNSIIGHADQKNRSDHRHHAIDALVTALSDSSAVKRLAEAAERAERTNSKMFAEIDPPFDGLLSQARALVESMQISSRVNRKVNGGLHEETILSHPKLNGFDKTGKAIESYHVRKSLDSLSTGEVDQIVDHTIRELVQKALKASGKPPEDTFKDPRHLPHLHGKNGRTTVIRRVRIRKSANPIQIGSGSKSRYVNPGANHHMAIVAVLDKDGQEVKWEGHLVTRFEAQTRVRLKQPVVQKDFGKNRRFKFWLSGGDHLLLRRKDEVDELCRVVVLSGSQLEFVFHSNANPINVRKKTPGERIRCSVSRLLELHARKVELTPLGKVIEVCEEVK